MDVSSFLQMLRSKGSSDDYDTSGDSSLKTKEEKPTEHLLKKHNHDDKHHPVHKELGRKDENPFSQKDLQDFIESTGFNVDEVPKFTEMAKRLNLPIKHEIVKKDLTNLDNHDNIQDISPSRRNESQIHKEALKRILEKYKG